MEEYIYRFNQWNKLNEADEYSIDQQIQDISDMIELGVLPKSELTKILRTLSVDNIVETSPELNKIVNSPEYKALQENGLKIVSSRTQLLNGTVIIGFPDYNRGTSYAIGLFPGPKMIRRMMPKNIPLGVWRRPLGSMDFRIKQLRNLPSNEFYIAAMRWILDHIDLENPEFPVKHRTRKGYFDRA